MNVVIKTKKEPLNTRVSIPVCETTKRNVELMKEQYNVDYNEMVRSFTEDLIKKVIKKSA